MLLILISTGAFQPIVVLRLYIYFVCCISVTGASVSELSTHGGLLQLEGAGFPPLSEFMGKFEFGFGSPSRFCSLDLLSKRSRALPLFDVETYLRACAHASGYVTIRLGKTYATSVLCPTPGFVDSSHLSVGVPEGGFVSVSNPIRVGSLLGPRA